MSNEKVDSSNMIMDEFVDEKIKQFWLKTFNL